MSDSVRPHRWQSIRLLCPWDSPGKSTGVGCHCLLQCMKVKSESEVAQLCPSLSDPMDCSPPGSSIHGILQASVLEWGAIAFLSFYFSYFSHLLNLSFKKIFIFNWRITALQCCVGFCHKTTWISRKYTYLFPLGPPSHTHPIHYSRLSQSTGQAPCVTQKLPTNYLFYTW